MKKFLIFIAIVAVAGAGIGYYLYQKPKTAMEDMKSYAAISAEELVQKFLLDEAAAEAEFLDKTVEVRGKVKDINESGIILEGGDEMTGVLCEFENAADVTSVKVQQEVTVKGVCTGKLLDVVLSRCIITE